MKKILLCLYIIFLTLFCSPTWANEQKILQRAFNAPASVSQNAEKLAKYLTAPFNDDYDKLKVIAYWMASHLAYDAYKFDKVPNEKQIQYKYDVLKSKAGICSDFAKLFIELCKAAGIKNVYYISGYAYKASSVKKIVSEKELKNSRHAWNAVVINKKTINIDVTFMAPMTIGKDGKKYKSTFKHKMAINQRSKSKTDINTDIYTEFFDFSYQQVIDGYVHKALRSRKL